jgi:uroporphyrinogen decarboxylase
MTPRERVWAALRGAAVDRPPISFWGHFYHRESSARELVDATLEFQARYGWDWVKLNPRKHYHVEPWGVRYRYPGVPDVKPKLESWPVTNGADWTKIRPVPHDQGALGEQIEAVRLLRERLPADVPMIETVFTPLAILGEMTETTSVLQSHLDSHPDAVRAALDAVTDTFMKFVRAILDAGADGIYFATVDWASRDHMTPEQYREWARPWDIELIRSADDAHFNVLHVCRSRNLLYEVADYPVHAFSWAATDATNPSLRDALAKLPVAVMGGIPHEGVLDRADPAEALRYLREGFDQTDGHRWLAAPGCSIPPVSRPEVLAALREAVEGMHSTRR